MNTKTTYSVRFVVNNNNRKLHTEVYSMVQSESKASDFHHTSKMNFDSSNVLYGENYNSLFSKTMMPNQMMKFPYLFGMSSLPGTTTQEGFDFTLNVDLTFVDFEFKEQDFNALFSHIVHKTKLELSSNIIRMSNLMGVNLNAKRVSLPTNNGWYLLIEHKEYKLFCDLYKTAKFDEKLEKHIRKNKIVECASCLQMYYYSEEYGWINLRKMISKKKNNNFIVFSGNVNFENQCDYENTTIKLAGIGCIDVNFRRYRGDVPIGRYGSLTFDFTKDPKCLKAIVIDDQKTHIYDDEKKVCHYEKVFTDRRDAVIFVYEK